jgi:hypothetical protein
MARRVGSPNAEVIADTVAENELVEATGPGPACTSSSIAASGRAARVAVRMGVERVTAVFYLWR